MAPKPRIARKASTASKDAPPTAKDAKGSMPPPPDPVPPALILEPEIMALSACLKNAVVKTGQIYGFYADTQKLGIQKHAPHPPRSLTASLGREVEKYDQLCDAIESQLLRAISVLERDLAREERRIEEAKTAAVSTRTRSKSASLSPSSRRLSLPVVPGASAQGQTVDTLPPTQNPPGESSTSVILASSHLPGRRQSSIFLSSLQRPHPPPKLDLSSIARTTAEESSLFSSGLASPVTLAPRSARPSTTNELPPDLMAFASAPSDAETVDIDLTVPDDTNTSAGINVGADGVDMMLNAGLGSSPDKPIELDMEMDIDMSIFGHSAESTTNDTVDGLFSPPAATPDIIMSGTTPDAKSVKREDIGMEMLDALSVVGETGENEDIFGSLGANSRHNIQSGQDLPTHGLDMSLVAVGSSPAAIAPSPASLLASFESAAHPGTLSAAQQNVAPDTPFDFDLSTLSAGMFANAPAQELDLEELFNIGGQSGADTQAEGKSGSLEILKYSSTR